MRGMRIRPDVQVAPAHGCWLRNDFSTELTGCPRAAEESIELEYLEESESLCS